ncbi:hypothetical protein Tco_0424234, partial [Tanacetum coccineum]
MRSYSHEQKPQLDRCQQLLGNKESLMISNRSNSASAALQDLKRPPIITWYGVLRDSVVASEVVVRFHRYGGEINPIDFYILVVHYDACTKHVIKRADMSSSKIQGFEIILPGKATMEHTIIPSTKGKSRKDIERGQNFLRIAIQ